jgi:serine/threonine protein kinase
VLYRKGVDVFYAEDQRDDGEDIAEHGVLVTKDEIFVAYKTTMLQYCQSPDDNRNFVKEYPIVLFTPGDTTPRDSFANELAVFERLCEHLHPGICKYKGCVVVDGYVEAFVLERYKCNLQEAVNEGMPFDKEHVFSTITDAVAHLHSLGLVHNDLSPRNIMLDDNLQPVLIDMETCMPEGSPPIFKIGTPEWSGNWTFSTVTNDKIALKRIRALLDGIYNPGNHLEMPQPQPCVASPSLLISFVRL